MRIGISYYSKDGKEELAVHAFADKTIDILGHVAINIKDGQAVVESNASGVDGGKGALLEQCAKKLDALAAKCRAGFVS